MEITVAREQGAEGLRGLTLSAVLDHTSDVVRDSAALALSGVTLPEIPLEPLGGLLNLGEGESTFSLRRIGNRIDARLRWASTDLGWSRVGLAGSLGAERPQIGTAEWARDLVWRTLVGIERVELDMGLQGELESPSLTVSSNLGEAVAQSLRRELGEQIQEAEAQLREEVDRRIQPLVQDARARIESVRTEVADRVAAQRAEIDALRARLEARVQQLTGNLNPPG
jgi:polyhydroxyalkanoate synthesis regulator phasin